MYSACCLQSLTQATRRFNLSKAAVLDCVDAAVHPDANGMHRRDCGIASYFTLCGNHSYFHNNTDKLSLLMLNLGIFVQRDKINQFIGTTFFQCLKIHVIEFFINNHHYKIYIRVNHFFPSS